MGSRAVIGELIDLGMGKLARRGFHLNQVAIVPSRRTRDTEDVSTAWQLDAFTFSIPMVTHPSDATVSPHTAVSVGELGGLGVLNVEGLWTRYDDPRPQLAALAAAAHEDSTALAQKIYSEPIKPHLIAERIRQMQEIAASKGTESDARIPIAVRLSPQ
ncbi:MAG: GuaB3 family IMP dehydrogenase-related protein, partial [Mycobacteriales bacterium]